MYFILNDMKKTIDLNLNISKDSGTHLMHKSLKFQFFFYR